MSVGVGSERGIGNIACAYFFENGVLLGGGVGSYAYIHMDYLTHGRHSSWLVELGYLIYNFGYVVCLLGDVLERRGSAQLAN
jgi:hypothetical protein